MYSTIGVHDPIPEDIEIQHYQHEGEPRVRVRLLPDGPTQGFGGISIHAEPEKLVNFLTALLAKVVDKPTTIELEGEAGEYVIHQRHVVVPITTYPVRFQPGGPTQTIIVGVEDS